jgi:hypothetical protein
MPFILDREHNELPLENWQLCREITTVCCENNTVHIHTHTHTHTHTNTNMYIYIYIYYVYKETGFRILALMIHKLATSLYRIIRQWQMYLPTVWITNFLILPSRCIYLLIIVLRINRDFFQYNITRTRFVFVWLRSVFYRVTLHSKYFSRNEFNTSVLYNKKTLEGLKKDREQHGSGNRKTFVPGWREPGQVN